jgi:hypothetical protein
MKVAALMISAVIVIMLLAAAITSIDDFRMTDQADPFNVTTGDNVTTATVTLSQELFGDETRNASVSSNLTSDAPIASSYDDDTQVLTITGLTASESRRLTITYSIDALTDYWGAGIAARMWPLILIIGVLAIVVGAVYAASHRGD